jgi:hypothetical protein
MKIRARRSALAIFGDRKKRTAPASDAHRAAALSAFGQPQPTRALRTRLVLWVVEQEDLGSSPSTTESL